LKLLFIWTLCLAISMGCSSVAFASPFNLVCKSQETENIIPLSIDLDQRTASFGGIEELEPINLESEKFIVWSKVIQYNENSTNSSVSVETFLFDRSNGELTTGFVSTDKPMNGMLGNTLNYSCRKNENVL